MRLFVVLLMVVLVPFFLWDRQISELASHWLTRDVPVAGVWTAVVLLLALDVWLPVPSSIVSVAAGALLGFKGGFLANLVGMMVGCVMGYGTGVAAEPWARRKLVESKDWPALQERMKKHAAVVLVASRPVPVLAEMSVMAAGVLRVPWRPLVGVVVLGNVAVAAIYAGVGALGYSEERLLLAFAATVGGAWLAMKLFNRWLQKQ